MAVVIRNCVLCGKEMPTSRASRDACSEYCNNRLSYLYRKEYKKLFSTRGEFVRYLKSLILEGRHIYAKHPLYKEEMIDE